MPQPLDPQRLMAPAIPPRVVAYDASDAMLYALAVGLGTEDLPFVYERDLAIVPSFAQSLAFNDGWLASGGIDLKDVVHGSLDMRFGEALAPGGEVAVAARITGVTDKGAGRGGIVVAEVTVEQGGARVATMTNSVFVRGAGGFGGSVGEEVPAHAVPAGEPAHVVEVATAENAALLFRLLGDKNPLHADPELARSVGFERPILHGACTFGIACATILREFAGRDPKRVKRLAARFSGPLYPGETLRLSFYDTDGGLAFRADTKERGSSVLDNGFAEIDTRLP